MLENKFRIQIGIRMRMRLRIKRMQELCLGMKWVYKYFISGQKSDICLIHRANL